VPEHGPDQDVISDHAAYPEWDMESGVQLLVMELACGCWKGREVMLAVHYAAAARRSRRRPARCGSVQITRVHPDAWSLALILADGNPQRRQALSDGSALVVNKPRGGPR